ncbi:hypothetical protein ACVGXO_00440, partial [Enterobacter hormaechei]
STPGKAKPPPGFLKKSRYLKTPNTAGQNYARNGFFWVLLSSSPLCYKQFTLPNKAVECRFGWWAYH